MEVINLAVGGDVAYGWCVQVRYSFFRHFAFYAL